MHIEKELLRSVVEPAVGSPTPPRARLLSWTERPLQVLAWTNEYCHEGAKPDSFGSLPREKEVEYWDAVKFDFNSICELTNFVFCLENIPAAFLAQISRHRFLNLHVQSLRVDDQSEFKYFLPSEILLKPEAKNVYTTTMQTLRTSYRALRELGISPEMARGVLPTHVFYKLVLACNLRSLTQLCSQRLCFIAQPTFWRPLLLSMRDELMVKVDPKLGDIFVPLCAMKGVCLSPREQSLRVTGKVPYAPCPIFKACFTESGEVKKEASALSETGTGGGASIRT